MCKYIIYSLLIMKRIIKENAYDKRNIRNTGYSHWGKMAS